MFSGSEDQKSLLPAALDDFIRRVHHVQTPDEAGPANRANLARATRNRAELFSKPGSVFPDRLEQGWIRQPIDDMASHRSQRVTW